MLTMHITLPLQNEASKPVKVILEPLAEYFIVKPGCSIEIHGIFDAGSQCKTFAVAPNDGYIVIYAPGDIPGFMDCYATSNGVKLVPDGG